MRRGRLVTSIVAALVLIVAAGACSADPSGDDVAGRPTTSTTTPAATGTPPDCGNPRDSYAPPPTRPSPGAMPAGSKMAEIQDRGRLIVGVSADTLLFGFRNPLTGQLEGFDIDMARQVAAAIFGATANPDEHIEYRVMAYSGRIPALTAQDVDMVADVMTINCPRWAQIAFSSEYFTAGQKVMVAKDSGYQSIEDLAGKKACAATTSTSEKKLLEYPDVEAVIVPQVSDCMVLFQSGQIEGIVGDDTVLAGFVAQDPYAVVVGPALSDEPYGLGFNLDDIDFVRFANSVLADVRADGTWARLYVDNGIGTTAPAPPDARYGRG